MRQIGIHILHQILLLLALLFPACKNSETENPVQHAHKNLPDSDSIERLISSPNKQVLSRQKAIKLSVQRESHAINSPGYIALDNSRSQIISARFGGRIERLYVKYDLQHVKKGDKILELYSTELNTFQQEHLFLLKSGKENSLLEQSRQKLKLLGIGDNQILLLEKNGTFTQAITVYSPADGYVLFNTEINSSTVEDVAEKTSVNNMNMAAKSNIGRTFGRSASQVREGMYINKGESLFRINDMQNVWAIVSVSAEFHSALNEKSQVKIISELFPDKQLIGKMVLVEQSFEENKQRFMRVRFSLPNINAQLKLNSLVTAELTLEGNNPDSYRGQIPASAVYHTGLNSFVWLKTGTTQNGTGIFKLRKVTTGSVNDGMITVINGLSVNEEVAWHAGLLTDSETFLSEH